jgi:hypothetical protein
MTTATIGKQAHLDYRTQRQASNKAIYGPRQMAPRGGLPEPRIPHQAQAQEIRHDEKLHDFREPHLGPNGSDTMSFPKENAIMMVYRGLPPPPPPPVGEALLV